MNAIVKASSMPIAVQRLAPAGMFSSPEKFEFAQRVASVFANSQLVPAHLRGKVADCLIALHMAERLNDDPLTTMQNIMVINGKPGWMTSYMIARANLSGALKGRITWRSTGQGDKLEVTAVAILAEGDQEITASVSMAMAKAEGWTNNKKYQTMAEHMLKYRSAAMLIRLHVPEVMLGFQTAEEIETIGLEPRDVTPRIEPEQAKATLTPPRPPSPPKPPSAPKQVEAEVIEQHSEPDWQAELLSYDSQISACEDADALAEAVEMFGARFDDAPADIQAEARKLADSQRQSIERNA